MIFGVRKKVKWIENLIISLRSIWNNWEIKFLTKNFMKSVFVERAIK